VEFLSQNDKEKYKKEIDEIDLSCRLNITACMLKLEDYDFVIYECNKILQTKNDNWKAHCRAGIAYFKKGKFKQALHHLEKYKQINPTSDDKIADNCLKQAKREIELAENEERQTTTENNTRKEEEKNAEYRRQPESVRTEENVNSQDRRHESEEKETASKPKKNKETKNIEENKADTHKFVEAEEPKKVSSKKEYLKNIESEGKKKETNSDEPQIENIEPKPSTEIKQNYKPSHTPTNSSPNPFGMDEQTINEAKKKFENMSDNEMDFMASQFRNMDNATIKSLYAMNVQNLSDEQINMMKMQMNPSMLKMAAKASTGGTNMNAGINTNSDSSTTCTHNQPTQVQANTNTGSAPSFPQGMDFSSMLKFAQQNPDMLKNMMGNSGMFGGGQDNQKMMQSMETIFWLLGFPQRIKSFFGSTQGKIFIAFVIMLIIAYYYR